LPYRMNLANTRKESYVELGRPALTFLRSKAKIVAAHVLLDSRPIDFTQKQMRSSVTFAQTDWLIVLASSAIDNHHRF
jgi:hypothetical protein